MPRLLLYAWDSADWKVINQLLDSGDMPHLKTLVEGGAVGDLFAPPPRIGPILWTSIATGRTPDVHRILQHTAIDELTGEAVPPSRRGVRSPALWQLLSHAGLRAHVAGWPVTHPAEELSGVVVSDAFARMTTPANQPWPIFPDSVHPRELERELAALRFHAGDLTGDDLLPFVPDLAGIDQTTDQRLLPLAAGLAETITLHGAATWILEYQPWDFLAAYSPLIGAVSRAYMRYASPRLSPISETDERIFGKAVPGAYRFQDLMLGRLLQLAGPETLVIIVSEHGFLSEDSRPAIVAQNQNEDYWPRSHGILCLSGPGIRKDELLHGAGVLDVAPTVLACFGLSLAGMPGRVLAEAFEHAPSRNQIEAPDMRDDDPLDQESSAAAAYFAELGYSDPIAAKLEAQRRTSGVSEAFNHALVHINAGRPAEAIPLLRRVVDDAPAETPAKLYLAYAFLLTAQLDECVAMLDTLPPDPFSDLIRGRLLLMQGRTTEALAFLHDLETSGGWTPEIGCLLGDVHRLSGRYGDAERSYRAVLAKEPGIAHAHLGLAQVLLLQRRYEPAAESALDAIRTRYDLAPAHYLLGVALARMRMFPQAIDALENCAKLAPQNESVRHLIKRLRASHTR